MSTSRRSKRQKTSDNGGDNPATPVAEPKRLTKSLKSVSYCTEVLPNRLCCSGCVRFIGTFKIGTFSETKLVEKNLARSTKFKADKFQCKKPWLTKADDASQADGKWIQNVHAYINEVCPNGNGRGNAIQDLHDEINGLPLLMPAMPRSPPGEIPAGQPTAITPSPPKQSKPAKTLDDVKWKEQTVHSDGVEVTIQVPTTHTVIHNSKLGMCRNNSNAVLSLRKSFKNKKFAGGSDFMRTLLGIALASAPSFALSTMAFVIPIVVASLLADHGILNYSGFDWTTFATSFPSESWMRGMMFQQAAQCAYSLGEKLVAMKVFLACDKGNKKRLDHFVKCLSWFCPRTASVQTCLLDLDATGGSTEDCCAAIEASLKKVGSPKLQGGTTDSGGAAAIDNLHDGLDVMGLCQEDHIAAACSIQNLQCQLSNPVEKLLGEGGLDKKNVMQLLHCAHDLQEALNWKEFLEVIDCSAQFASKHVDTPFVGKEGDEGDEAFAPKWERVKTFRDWPAIRTLWPLVVDDEGNEKTSLRKMPQAVLTRCWCVGEAASVVWRAFLLLFRSTQVTINVHGTDRAGKIASGMQPLMLEPVLFSDLALVKCFHEAYFNEHMAWMMKSDDLTGKCGFQSHQMIVRHFCMAEDLKRLQENLFVDTDDTFRDFRDALSLLDDAKIGDDGMTARQKQAEKARKFLKMSEESLHKHFGRWCDVLLAPAGLMAEPALAKVLAAIILGTQAATETEEQPRLCCSEANKQWMHLQAHETFLRDQRVTPCDTEAQTHKPEVMNVCQQLLAGALDLRMLSTNCVCLQLFMWSLCLPIASNTQFVEAGVKEASLVSKTGRSEELRSACAILRSHWVKLLGETQLSAVAAPAKALRFIRSATGHCQEQEGCRSEQRFQRIKSIIKSLKSEHCKAVREDALVKRIEKCGNKNRKENKRQQTSGVDETARQLGVIPFSSVTVRGGHLEALQFEMVVRGFDPEWVVETNKITDLMKAFKKNEMERVQEQHKHSSESDRAHAVKIALKHFVQQSDPQDAQFKMD